MARQAHLDLVIVCLRPPYARMMRKVWLDKVCKLWVNVQRVANLRHTCSLFLLLLALSLPELLPRRLAGCGTRVDGA